MAPKTHLSKNFAKCSDRAYMYLKTKQGKTVKNLNSSMRLKLFETGNSKLRWEGAFCLTLYSDSIRQVPEKGLQNIRIALYRKLSKSINKTDLLIRFTRYPHMILRYHAVAQGAHADRISQGMRKAFGKPFGKAVRVKPGDSFLQVYYRKIEQRKFIETALKSVAKRLTFRSYIK